MVQCCGISCQRNTMCCLQSSVRTLLIFLQVIILISTNASVLGKRPNIVLIVADDVGRNDISLHGSSQIPTPNIDALGYNGIIFNRHYTMHICTPSRAALLTGNYPIRAGLQGSPIAAGEPRALPIDMPTIAERLSDLGYTTHMIGKWHLGHQNRSVTPLGRGFHTHLGYWSGFVGYFDYRIFEDGVGRFSGFDLHDGYKPFYSHSNVYATNFFTNQAIKTIKSKDQDKPFFLVINHLAGHTGTNGTVLETPNAEDVIKKYTYIKEPKRRIYADIIMRLDESVGEVVNTLNEEKILNDTVIVFMSDNGAMTTGYYENFGSNWPSRGLKSTLYEGGVKNVAVMWCNQLTQKGIVAENLVHVTDWLPTLYNAAGGDVSNLGPIDGINQWPYLTQNQPKPQRSDILLNIDEQSGHEAILSSDGKYKLLKGQHQNGISDGYFGDSGRSKVTPKYKLKLVLNSKTNIAISNSNGTPLTKENIKQIRQSLRVKQANKKRLNDIKCSKNKGTCLFNLIQDPTETTNIARANPHIVRKLKKSLDYYRTQLVPSRNVPADDNSNPKYCFDTWFTWLDPQIRCDVNIYTKVK